MANPGEALAATIDAQWNVGTGGPKPSDIEYIVNTSDFEPNPLAIDAIFVFLPLRGTKERFNSKLRNATYFPRVVCQTKTDTARLEQITNEVDRIVAAGTPITGATYQDVLEVNDISDRMRGGYPFWVSELNCKIFTQFESSATQYGTATVATLETDEFTVNSFITGLGLTITDFLDEDDMASDSAAALVSQQSIKAYVDVAYGAGMIGAVNAAWVPCPLMGWNPQAKGELTNVGQWTNIDGTACFITWTCPLPTNKDGLKLYVSGTRISLANADVNDYVTNTHVEGLTTVGKTAVDSDPTDKNSINLHTDTWTAVDMSAFFAVQVRLQTFQNDAGDLNIQYVLLQCYYDI